MTCGHKVYGPLVATTMILYALQLSFQLADLPEHPYPYVVQTRQMALVTALTVLLIQVMQLSKCHKRHLMFARLAMWLMLINTIVRWGYKLRTSQEENLRGIVSRWDSMSVFLGAAFFITESYFFVTPDDTFFQYVFFCLAMFAGIPLFLAIPYWVRETTSFDTTSLVQSALWCLEAYGQTTTAKADVLIKHLGNGDVVIAFNGTREENLNQDMKLNIKVKGSTYPLGWLSPDLIELTRGIEPNVHAGYLEAFTYVRERCHDAIRDKTTLPPGAVDGYLLKKAPPKYPSRIIITGHSLGGGLAVLAALSLSASLPPSERWRIRVHTFGAPSVGDALFVNLYSACVADSTRVAHPYDPIPRAFSSQFVHVPRMYHVTSDIIDSREAHKIVNYIKALENESAAFVSSTKPVAGTLLAGGLVLGAKAVYNTLFV